MNLQHAMISNTCRGCIEENNFTDNQKEDLKQILDKFESVKISNIYKFTKYLKQFEDKYKEYGGDHNMLLTRIRKIRDEQYLAAAKIIPGVKIEKKVD